jgi:N utilization substance protein B
MSTNRRSTIRRLAMLILYQIDQRGETDLPAIRQGLQESLHRVPLPQEPEPVRGRVSKAARLKAEEDRQLAESQEARRAADVAEALNLQPGEPEPTPEEAQRAIQLAQAVWENAPEADEALNRLAPDWPTYRQPVLDRAILRLAYYEMALANVPGSIVINEAVELARQYCTHEKSPKFINAVLDNLAKGLAQQGHPSAKAPKPPPRKPSGKARRKPRRGAPERGASGEEAWLRDALGSRGDRDSSADG